MVTILHGENTVQSRDKLVQMIDQAKKTDSKVTRLEAKKLTLANLEENLGSSDLFGSNKLIIVEGLHSLPRSKNKTALIKLVAANQLPVILWEKRSLTKTMLKQFPQTEVFEFKLSKTLFKWLDSINSLRQEKSAVSLFHQTLQTDDVGLCFAMLTRQIRLLIQAKDGGVVRGAPFMISKLKKQAAGFDLDQLLELHSQLLDIDLKLKTSTGNLSLEQELDLLLLNM